MMLFLGVGAVLSAEFVIIAREIRLGNKLTRLEASITAARDNLT